MRTCVVDASVVAVAFFQEEHSDAAQALLTSGIALLAPDLITAEFANVIWKRCGRREIDPNEAGQLLTDFLRLPLQITASVRIAELALQLAVQTKRTVYDCLYLALAVTSGATLITSDRRLVNSLSHTPLSEHVRWIGSAEEG